jgi:hypothetical protein
MFVDVGACLLAAAYQWLPLLALLFWLSAILSQYSSDHKITTKTPDKTQNKKHPQFVLP